MSSDFLIKLAGMRFQRAGIFALIFAGVFWATLYDDGASVDASIAAVATELAAEEAKSAQSDAALREVDLIKTTMATLQDQFKSVSQQLPTEIQTTEIIKTIDVLAKTAGVRVKEKEPEAPKRSGIVEEYSIRVVLQGTYSEIAMFLFYLSSTERIHRISKFTIDATSLLDVDVRGSKSLNLDFKGVVSGYRFVGSSPSGEEKK